MEIVRRQTVILSSINRAAGTISDANLILSPLIAAHDDDQKVYVVPTSFVMSRSWYSVDALNNSFEVIDIASGVVVRYSVTPGNHNVRTFLIELQTTLPLGWIVGYDTITNRYVFKPPAYEGDDGHEYGLRFDNFLAFQCGFPRDASLVHLATNAEPLTSRVPVVMCPGVMVMVNTSLPIVHDSNLDTLRSDGELRETSALVKCPAQVAPYDMLVWRSNDVEQNRFPLCAPIVSSLHITITDEYNRVLQLTTDWVLTLHIEYWAPSSVPAMAKDVQMLRDYVKYLVLHELSKSGKKHIS